MMPISERTHGVIDYVMAFILYLAPNLFGFASLGGPAVWIPRAIAILIILQALITDYDLGLSRTIPFQVHLVSDYMLGTYLAVSPFFYYFNVFSMNVWVPHVAAGIALLAITYLTRDNPLARRQTLSANKWRRIDTTS